MRQRSQNGLTYFACLLLLNIVAGGAVAIAKSADSGDVFSITAVEEVLSKFNGNTKLGALTRPGECGVGEVVCAHDGPKKGDVKTASLEVVKPDAAPAR